MKKTRHKFIFKIKQKHSVDKWEINNDLDWTKENTTETEIKCLRLTVGIGDKKYLVHSLASIIQYCNEWLQDIKEEVKDEQRKV